MKIISRKRYNEILENAKTLKEEGLNTYEVQYTVSYTTTVKAASPSEAQSIIRKQHDGNDIMFKGTKEIKDPDNKEISEDIDFGIEDIAEPEITPPAPEGEDVGMTSVVQSLIADEFEAIDGYNSAIATAKEVGAPDAVSVLSSIANEENAHVGELQTVLKQFSDQAQTIAAGEREAQTILMNSPQNAVPAQQVPGTEFLNPANFINIEDVDDDLDGIESYM